MKATNNINRKTLTAAINETAARIFPRADELRARLRAQETAAQETAARAEMLTTAALMDGTRAAKAAAKAARAAARAADDALNTTAAQLALMDADALTRRADIVVSFRERTAADNAAAAALKAYRAAVDEYGESGTSESRAALKAAKAAADNAAAIAETAAASAPRYAFTMGAPAVNEHFPAAPYKAAYTIINAYGARAGITPADMFVMYDITADETAAAVQRAARVIAKRAAYNCVDRQGTSTQWAMYNAACAGNWNAQDLADIISTAILGLLEYVTETAAAPADDLISRADILRGARKAAFVAINEYLSSMRAIRADAFKYRDIPLEQIADTTAAPADDSEYRARRADIIRRADAAAREMLTPAEKRALSALVRTGGNERAAARKLNITNITIHETRARIAGKYAAAVDAVAGDSIELHVLRLAETAAAVDAAAARAIKLKAAAADAETAAALIALIDSLPTAQKRAAFLIGRGNTYRAAAETAAVTLRALAKAAQAAADKLRAACPAAAETAAAADILRAAVAAYDAAARADA